MMGISAPQRCFGRHFLGQNLLKKKMSVIILRLKKKPVMVR